MKHTTYPFAHLDSLSHTHTHAHAHTHTHTHTLRDHTIILLVPL